MEWISVKDELPKQSEQVLCYSKGCYYIKIYEGIFYDGDTYCYCPVGQLHDVTHWMPLPPPPDKQGSDAMYTMDYINDLNEWGMISTAFLARRYGISFRYAKKILEEIVEDYENVIFHTPTQIYIEGRDLEEWNPKPKTPRLRPKKFPRWKDVTKP